MNKDITINCVEPLSDLETFIKDIPAQLHTGDRIHMKSLKFINLMRKYESLFPMFSPPSLSARSQGTGLFMSYFSACPTLLPLFPWGGKGKNVHFPSKHSTREKPPIFVLLQTDCFRQRKTYFTMSKSEFVYMESIFVLSAPSLSTWLFQSWRSLNFIYLFIYMQPPVQYAVQILCQFMNYIWLCLLSFPISPFISTFYNLSYLKKFFVSKSSSYICNFIEQKQRN